MPPFVAYFAVVAGAARFTLSCQSAGRRDGRADNGVQVLETGSTAILILENVGSSMD